MPKSLTVQLLDRRQFAVGAATAAMVLPSLLRAGQASAQEAPRPAAAAADAGAPSVSAAASPTPAPPPESFDDLYARLTNGAKPTEGKIAFEIPEIAENGNTVPFVITADSPMTAENHVKTIHLLSTANPQAGIAAFRFTPESGKAVVSSRMRLAKTQDVVALAEISNGQLWVARAKITVTIGGCGG